MDYYDLLGIPQDASDVQISTAYRRKALECHPDKNRSNPRAAELFGQLKKAQLVLLDAAARKTYDSETALKRAVVAREKEFGEKRRAMKEELFKREKEFEQAKTNAPPHAAGARPPDFGDCAKLKIKTSGSKIVRSKLEQGLRDAEHITVGKTGTSAIVQFKSTEAARRVMDGERYENPLLEDYEFEWASEIIVDKKREKTLEELERIVEKNIRKAQQKKTKRESD